MISECEVPEPVKLNCWKHHLMFIKEQISNVDNNVSGNELRKILLLIGESQMDLYFGKLSPKQISIFIINKLKKKRVYETSKFKEWIVNDGKNYRMIYLPDKSTWILREGNEIKRYIHIHPGRYSPLTFRVKSLTLKGAIAVVTTFGVERSKKLFLDDVNSIRKEILNQPPLKSISANAGQGNIILTLCG